MFLFESVVDIKPFKIISQIFYFIIVTLWGVMSVVYIRRKLIRILFQSVRVRNGYVYTSILTLVFIYFIDVTFFCWPMAINQYQEIES